jgi:deferrochelatase/peroxidase EfeB
MTTSPLEIDDIQALLTAGFGALTEAAFLLLTIADRAAANAWLAGVAVTSVGDLKQRLDTAVQVAVSAGGLAALGLAEATLAGFSAEFVGGMSGDPSRSRRLGDVGANDPSNWAWGGARGEPHLLLMLYAGPGGLAALQAAMATPDFRAGFAAVTLPTSDMGGREPFGFVDGVSQPAPDWDGARTPGTLADLDYTDLVAAGEFVLGYPNEYGQVTGRPTLPEGADPGGLLPAAPEDPARRDLGRNGAYLVFRQLGQDVRGFWRFVGDQAPAAPTALAEAMVGRRITGEAIEPGSGAAIPGVGPAPDDARRNAFTYDGDPDGLACPLGAHVRRANPRTADMPGGQGGWISRLLRHLGLRPQSPRADVVAASRFHRILRRGREYGRFIDPVAAADPGTPDPGSGLNFICLNANLARQFEFVQGAWLASARFGGLAGEQDPLLGERSPFPSGFATGAFTIPRPDGRTHRIGALPRFVTVRGGAYFFLPGIRALRFLAAI